MSAGDIVAALVLQYYQVRGVVDQIEGNHGFAKIAVANVLNILSFFNTQETQF